MEKRLIFLLILGVLFLNLVAASSYEIQFNQVGNKLVINESINNSQNRSYNDTESLNFAEKEIYFLNKLIFPDNFERANITLNLEEGMVIKNKGVFPLGYTINSDGQIISINWNLNNVTKGDAFAIFVNLEDTKNRGLSPTVIFLIFFISFGLFWFIVLREKKILIKPVVKSKEKKEKTKSPREYDYLLDPEKKIIEDLKKADRNELWQRQIQVSTGFSKAKVSRLIRNLESRGLIKKIPFGNTNKIRLR